MARSNKQQHTPASPRQVTSASKQNVAKCVGKPRAGRGATQKPARKPVSPRGSAQKPVHNSPCAVDALCGGCTDIAVLYDQQLQQKDAAIHVLFAPVLGTAQLLPIMGMEDPFHYRNKIISPFAPGKKKKQNNPQGKQKQNSSSAQHGASKRGLSYDVLTGMYAQGTHKLIPTNDCLIENVVGKRIVRALVQLMSKYGIEPYNEDTGAGFLRHVVVRVGHESGEVLVTLVTNEADFPHSKSFCKELCKLVPSITTVVQNINTRQTNVILGTEERKLYGPGFILDTLCGLSFRISSQSFYQVNAVQTELLYNKAIEFAQLSEEQTLIDAYCGTGTIGLVAAKRGAQRVIGVESVAQAVLDARQNARHNGITNAEFVCDDATNFMHKIASGDYVLDVDNTVLMMDPPRAGSTPEFIQSVARAGIARVVYVSCDPSTQVRDIALFQKQGYVLHLVQPVDMFPHTKHVECVALLSRVGQTS